MQELDEIGNRLLVIYDGHCSLCNGLVRWLLPRDEQDRLRFAASDSPAVAQLIKRHANLLGPNGIPGTVLVIRHPLQADELVWVRFKATLAVLRELPQPWPAIAATLGWIPNFLSDPIYRLHARWRGRIWGRLATCPLPAPEDRDRFL
jgi:predicted DCC family thiol-disulfide oxidoreductase YuxK